MSVKNNWEASGNVFAQQFPNYGTPAKTTAYSAIFLRPCYCANCSPNSCGQAEITQRLFAAHPEYKKINEQIETALRTRNQLINSGQLKVQRTNAVVTLPVVVHIIHNGGAENISDAQVFQGIQHLNEAYANTGYYDPSDGVNTQIQFCMAQRDPSNNATNGITRDVSTYTVMGGPNYYSDDQNVKNINRWNPLCYINIWLVRSMPVYAGYAYFPPSVVHGSNLDGIVMEAGYFGSSYSNDVIITHEMGHYLGLYHTFEGNCTNNDCAFDGDHVCDTPPDQSTAGISCTSSVNSCTTDVLSGFATDQNDLTQDYMDYGNVNCMKVFTQGQSDRMNWVIQNVRQSLLACKSCMSPCPTPIIANFSAPSAPFIAGNNYTFTNTSLNAVGYEWWVNGVLKSTASNFTYAFPGTGSFTVKLVAKSGTTLCTDVEKSIIVNAICGVTASFAKSATVVAAGTTINFTNTSTGADSYQWLVNGNLVSTVANFVYTSTISGDFTVQLIATNSSVNCSQNISDIVHFTCAVVTDFSPLLTTALINTPLTFTSSGTGETTYKWLINGTVAGTGPTLTRTFTTISVYSIQLITGNGICSSAKTITLYTTDKCGNAQYLFQKMYETDGQTQMYDIRSTSDGGSIQAGRIFYAGGRLEASILKLDAAGNTEWLNNYTTPYNGGGFSKIKQTSDGGFIAIGYTYIGQLANATNTNLFFIVKTLASGAVAWSRILNPGNGASMIGNDIIQATDGNYYFTASFTDPTSQGASGNADAIAGKLDATGNLVWINKYDNRGDETGNGIAEDNLQLIVCGSSTAQNATGGLLLKLNKSNGSIVWSKTYQSDNEIFKMVTVTADGYFIDGTRTISFTDHSYLKTDFNGVLKYSKYTQPYGSGDGLNFESSFIKPNGNIISLEYPQIATAANGGFMLKEINPLAGIVWTKQYSNLLGVYMTANTPAANNGILVAGIDFRNIRAPIYIMKLDSTGNTGGCPSENSKNELLTSTYAVFASDYTAKAFQPQIITTISIRNIDVATKVDCNHLITCDSTLIETCRLCDTIQLAGSDTICSFSKTGTYNVKRSPGCTAIPKWKLSDSTYGTITVINDSTIAAIFKKTGHIKLGTNLNTGCRVLKDSIDITILNSPDSVKLGPDIQLCKFSSLKLNAGAGFKSYLWNDGSVDSVLTAYNPGQYFVQATDYCGNIYSDTINLSQAPDVPFDLGRDLVICDNDTLTIAAPGSFLSYTWAANYNISSVTGATIKAWPAKDTTYTVVAQVATGCTVLDTIRVKVKPATPLQLGNNSGFCAGDSLVIHAPAGFTKYLWQDGSTGIDYTAKQKGIYWLHAEASNGCISKDSIFITNVYALPTGFLAATADKCNAKTIEIKAIGEWPAYLWFDNSTSSSVTVGNAGQYWLQVKNTDGCSARDSIVVKDIDCVSGIYFPNVFTPDHNGYNDTYRPIINYSPIKFHLRIYNRYGEKVFETTDYKQGWDGIYKGRLQPPDTYVWYCNHQLTGSIEKIEKGTLVLIR